MSIRTLVHEVFGEVRFDTEDELNEWDSEIPWADDVIDLGMWFGGATMDKPALDRLAKYVTDLASFDQKARVAIRANLAEDDSAVRDYIDHHLDEPELVRRLFGVDDSAAVDVDAFLAALRLVRVGLYSDTEISEYEATFDYTIDSDSTQYLVVVNFDQNGAVDEIAMES